MAQSTTPPVYIVGCDVGKASVVACNGRDGRTKTIPNEFNALLNFAAELDPNCLVICESTGRYEAELLAAMTAAAIPCHRADARKVKYFIRSLGTMAKSDAIDARGLVRYGEERHASLTRWQAPDEYRHQLQCLILARSDLIAGHKACKNRLSAPGNEVSKRYFQAIDDVHKTQIKAIDKDINQLIAQHKPLEEAVETLTDVGGVGVTTAASLLGLMPELGHMNRRQAASLGHLAPHPQQSGATDGYRRTRGGRPEVKRVLFMAALSAIKHNKDLRAFYERLIANGKKKMVAIVAVMRKLLVLCNALLRPKPAAAN